MTQPTFRGLTGVFLRVGNTTFGGGIPTLAALQRELVERQRWLSTEDYALAFSLARITPGAQMIAFCAAAGAKILGLQGALTAVLAETLPSAVLAVLITVGYETWRLNTVVMAVVAGIVAAVAGMMWSSVWSLVQPQWGGILCSVRTVFIAGGAFLALLRFGMNPLAIIGAAVVVGFLWKESGK
jgi:chromate transporter